jgi:nitrite reductase/ring-hydroxylating ferredoxin subunit
VKIWGNSGDSHYLEEAAPPAVRGNVSRRTRSAVEESMMRCPGWQIVDLGPADELLATDRAVVTVGPDSASVLVFRTRHGVFATASRCPHMGLPLLDARARGRNLTCRHHRRRYDLMSGACRSRGLERERGLMTYRAWIENGRLLLYRPQPANSGRAERRTC